jgi:hypothetical protein
MPAGGDGCKGNRQGRKRIKYKAELTYIIHEHGIVAVNLWVVKNCNNFNEVVWWRNTIREMETGQRLMNAEQEALWGPEVTQAIRTAGGRLLRKLVKAFLGEQALRKLEPEES